ncbi:MAG: M23 family metallopeptidase [Bacteroidales bacterium]|nr:M23 family metallopeptidase [Bacteroidales bacterium]
MPRTERYILNPETLMAELREEPRHRGWLIAGMLATALVMLLLYMWVTVGVLGNDLPKTAILKRQNADWSSRMDRMRAQMDRSDELLQMLEVRDDRIYRSVYGLDEIPQAVRRSGLGDDGSSLEGTSIKDVAMRLDQLEKRAYIQSKSFEDIALLQRTAGDLAAHIPAIPPMSTAPGTYRLSSPFGLRADPILGIGKRHTGMDFACPVGNPIYAAGDGVVVKVAHEHKGYGNHVEIDHGFGYKTRYAHMSDIYVKEGDSIKRGDMLGLSGRSGRATGPHLHYEVHYRKEYVNPALFMDLDIPPEEYENIVKR